MKISILCSNRSHPVFPVLVDWKYKRDGDHDISLDTSIRELKGGDILFLISCNEIVPGDICALYKNTLIIHASDLPLGRGWSPHIWQILEGKNTIKVSLLEARDNVDTGDIWHQMPLELDGTELYDEINKKLFYIESQLMDFAVTHASDIIPRKQDATAASYYKKRTPHDSRLDVNGTIKEQFDMLRVADPERYPAFFEYRGAKYEIKISKANGAGS